MTNNEFLEALLNLPDMRSPVVSPDGRWVAWTWLGLDPVGQVYVAPTDGSEPPLCFTQHSNDTYPVSWTPDGAAILVQSDRAGDERAQLFRVGLDAPGEMLPITEPEPNYFLRGGRLHPNQKWLVYGANFEVESNTEIEQTLIYRQDLESGERKVLARPTKPGTGWANLNQQGSHILYSRKDLHPSGRQVWLVDVEGETDRELFNFGDTTKVSASWFNDGERVLVLAEASNHRRLGVTDFNSTLVTWLIDDPNRNIEQAYVPPNSDLIVVLEIKDSRTVASLFNPQNGNEQILAVSSGNLVPLAPVGNGVWLGQYYSACQPAELVRFKLDDVDPAHFESVSRVWERTNLKADELIPAEDYHWHSVDELIIQGWLYRAKEAHGTVALIHGGPTAHAQDSFNSQVQYLGRVGFNVLAPNYRGSTGFGLAFQEAIKLQGWGGIEQDDIRSGLEALIKDGIALSGKIGVTGTSYGGYSAWCAITRFPTAVVAAAAPICGMTDLVVDYETTRPDLRPYSEEMMGGRPDQIPDKYRERSPLHFVGNIQGKLLIVQGWRDPNVTTENVRVVREALDAHNIEYDMLTFADEGHGIMHRENRAVLYQKLEEFFNAAFSTIE